MKSTLPLCIALLLVIAFFVSAEVKPVFPPVDGPFQVDVSYTPAFFGPDITFSGTYRSNGKHKFVIKAADSLRTSEFTLWRFDQGKAFVASKFGEFPWGCDTKDANFTGNINFAPFFGFDAQYFEKNATYEGQKIIDDKKYDVYGFSGLRTGEVIKNVTLYFEAGDEPTRPLLKVDEKVFGSEINVERSMTFDPSTFLAKAQDDSYFEIPQGVQC